MSAHRLDSSLEYLFSQSPLLLVLTDTGLRRKAVTLPLNPSFRRGLESHAHIPYTIELGGVRDRDNIPITPSNMMTETAHKCTTSP